jgi:predicted alpha/beta superfamily hydrolase
MENLKWIIGLFSFLLVNITHAQITKVQMPGPGGIKFKSVIDNQEYVLYITIPADYAKTDKKYPVLYVLDGQWSFTMTNDIYWGQFFDGLVPEVIIVGITWTDNYDANRKRDLSPTHQDDFPNSGNAPKFLSVIKNDVIKYIDSAYRTEKNNNALIGGSLGGLFALYTLFHEPRLFNRYIINSPTLSWDNEIVFKYERQFAEKNRTLNAKIFINSGEYEEATDPSNAFNRFNDQLKASNYKELEIESSILAKVGHVGTGAEGTIRGLQFIYKKPTVMIDTLVLDQYTGHYEQGVSISRTGNSIYVTFAGKTIRLYPETPEQFYIMGQKSSVVFTKDIKGKVTDYTFTIDNNRLLFKKLD